MIFRSRFVLLTLVVLLLAVSAIAQESKISTANFDLAEKFSQENVEKMVGDLRVNANWLEDADKFWYSYKTSSGRGFYLVDALRKQKSVLFDNDYLASELTRLTTKPYNALDLPVKNIKFNKTKSAFTFEVDSLRFNYVLSSKVVTLPDTAQIKKPHAWKTFAPDSSYIVFAKNHNLYLMKNHDPDSTEIQLTTDGELWFSYQRSDGDTTSNKRLRSRATWFPDSNKLYVIRQDKRKVEDLWVINSIAEPRPTLETYKYVMPGDKNIAQDELMFFDVASKNRVNVDVARWKDQTLGGAYFDRGQGVFMGKTSKKLWLIRRNREWNKVDLCAVDTESGELKVLFSEESKPYFNTSFMNLKVINDGEELIWFSERDGWGHLYLYDGDGTLKNKITSGPFIVGEAVEIDTTARTLYVEAYGREKGIDPYYNMYYSVGFDGSGMKNLTPEDANHSFTMSESKKFFVDTYSEVNTVPHTVLRDRLGNVVIDLETTDISMLLEAGFKMPEPFSVKAADGITDIYGVMWKPYDFDPTKKYPIITYVYPGPFSEPVPKSFLQRAPRLRNEPLAQLGFIVVAMGQRGGHEKRAKYYHNWGYGTDRARDYPLYDNRFGIEQLANRHDFIDIDKVGIYGHSGGGFMSTAAMLVYPDFYKVAVSSSGNHDNNIYNIYWGEKYYGVKEVQKKAKKGDKTPDEEAAETEFISEIANNPELAKNLKGHLLLVHGDIDNNVHPANSIRMVDALIKAGKRFDFMIMPGKRHGYGDGTKYFQRMLWYYFAEHLIGDNRKNVEIYKENQ